MNRFISIEYAPPETRRLLRERLMKNLWHDYQSLTPDRAGLTLTDDAMLQLLKALQVEFGNEWAVACATYASAISSEEDGLSLEERVDAGWARVIWDRVRVPTNVSMALHHAKDRAGAFARVLENRFAEKFSFNVDRLSDLKLLEISEDLQNGRVKFSNLKCPSPSWVAARLWDQAKSSDNDVGFLRTWVDRWILLGSPDLTPSRVWDSEMSERFKQAALHVIGKEKGLDGWEEARVRNRREEAVSRGEAIQDVQFSLPERPDTLVDCILSLQNGWTSRVACDWLRECDDLLGLVRLLCADIRDQHFSSIPHPLAAKLLDWAGSRPALLFDLTLLFSAHPELLADVILYPPTCALACLLIAQWPTGYSSFDRELVQRDNNLLKQISFEDAVSLLTWWLEKELAQPAEAGALLAWLHRNSELGFIDDLSTKEPFRIILRDALLSSTKVEAIVDTLIVRSEHLDRLGGCFAAALELIAFSNISSKINPASLVTQYVDAIRDGNFGLSARRINSHGAAALFSLAKRDPKVFATFLRPLDAREAFANADHSDTNTVNLEYTLARSLRTHISVLCRAINGCEKPIESDLIEALRATVWTGALTHREKGRIGVFAPRYENDTFGLHRDRPIAIDLAHALDLLPDPYRGDLLSVILEMDEPMVLAQLLSIVPRELSTMVEHRLRSLSPNTAGATYSLPELQTRIDALISAGVFDNAKRFMEEEAQFRTLGDVPGREVARLRTLLRYQFASGEWKKILESKLPSYLTREEKADAEDTILFYKGLTLLVQQECRDSEGAYNIFAALYRRHPAVHVYAVNAIAAEVGVVLEGNLFGRIRGSLSTRARKLFGESQEFLRLKVDIKIDDSNITLLNLAVLSLGLNDPERALGLLPTPVSPHLEERVRAYRAVALYRLGSHQEAVTLLKAAVENFGTTDLLKAAGAEIRQESFKGDAGVSTDNEQIRQLRDTYRALLVLDPIQQTAVVGFGENPFTAFVIEQVRGAAASIVSLVPMMKNVELDNCEDDVNAVVRELLLSRLDFLRWSAPDQSKGGITAKGNPGERDIIIVRGTTVLVVIEAIVCRHPVHWQTIQTNLRSHFLRLIAYSTCRLFFFLAYVYDQDIKGVIDQLKLMAENEAPPHLTYTGVDDIPLTDSRPSGFTAKYADNLGEINIVFLALNMGQEGLRAAALASSIPK